MNLLEPVPDDIKNELSEDILVCLKGVNKEWLICTSTSVFIYKKGFMTGNMFGYNKFHTPYQNISGVQVNKKFLTGYFEISSGGMQNTSKSTWDSRNSPMSAPNCITITSEEGYTKFRQACTFINQKLQDLLLPAESIANDIPHQIKKLAELKDAGILTIEEFENKKRELLAKM